MQMFIRLGSLFLFCVIVTWSTPYLNAYDASPSCYKDLQLNFFQTSIVSQALSLHRVDQSSWTPIVKLLQESSKNIPSIIKAKAQNSRPNPLDPIFIPDVAREILEETLYEVFSGVLISYNPYQQILINSADIEDMFGFIMSKQQQKFDSCLGTVKK